MNYLRDTQKKVQVTIPYTENVSIMTENFIGANTIRKLIEEKIKSNTSISLKSDFRESRAGPGLVSLGRIPFLAGFV